MDRCRQPAKATHGVLIIVQRNRATQSLTHALQRSSECAACAAAERRRAGCWQQSADRSCLVAQDEQCSSLFSRLRDRFLLHIARHAGEAAAEELLRGHELVRCSVSAVALHLLWRSRAALRRSLCHRCSVARSTVV